MYWNKNDSHILSKNLWKCKYWNKNESNIWVKVFDVESNEITVGPVSQDSLFLLKMEIRHDNDSQLTIITVAPNEFVF